MSANEFSRADLDALSRKLVDEGKIIAAGFAGMRLGLIARDAPQSQVDDMEAAFLGGAQHLWASMMSILDPDADPTPADLRRMELINRELEEFAERLKRRMHGEAH